MNLAEVKRKPSTFAVIGLVLFWLTPFSILKNMQMFSLAVVIASVIVLQGTFQMSHLNSIDARHILSLRKIHIDLLKITFITFFGTSISITLLSSSDDFNVMQVMIRLLSQYGALFVNMIIIICGYHMATYFGSNLIRKAIYVPFVITISICIYQSFSDSLGLPFIGKYEIDKFVGLRPSGLANEPKFLSSYLAIMIFFMLHELSGRVLKMDKFDVLLKGIGLVVSGYYFIAASSGNGILALCVLLILSFTRMKISRQLVMSFLIVISLIWLNWLLENDFFILRGSHKDILDNFSNLDLTYFDDLIALPIMAWRDNFWNLLIGFGPGLMHFFAHRYMMFSTWLTDDTYIEGNLSLIVFVSNFGLILFILFFCYFSKLCFRSLNLAKFSDLRSINFFFVSSFFVGVLVQGNMSIPFFLSLGWLLHSATKNKLFSTCIR